VNTTTHTHDRWTERLRRTGIELGLLVIGAVLFALSFPSFISEWGWAPVAFISLVPVFVVVHRCSWPVVPFYGLFYGFITYALFNFWLATFHPLAILIVPVIYAVYFFIVFPLLKLADTLFPRYGYLVQILIWLGYEYLRTKGYLGYPYGNIGYSQYYFIPLIQIASITGMWGVSLLVAFPSAYLGASLKRGLEGVRSFFRRHRADAVVYLAVIAAVLVYGFAVQRDYDDAPQWRVALVQHNADTWEGGTRAFRRNLNTLMELSDQALKQDPEIVIWSETAFVPSVDWHTKYRTDSERYALVRRFREYMKGQEVPFVTGNDDGQLEDPDRPPVLSDGSYNRLDYNAVLLYHDNELQETYRKVNLVPFTEHFPYEETFPRFYRLLREKDYHFWAKGEEYTVFEAGGVTFSTPICFEDTFGYLNRRFVREGADVIVNLTNDSWSGSVAAQMQHFAMAVFRAIENRRSVVRSANSGMTCSINPDGEVIDMLEPFTRDYLITEVPVIAERTTPYTRWGNAGIIAVTIAAGVLLTAGAVYRIVFRKGNRPE
jgi:apolipoprotein N-acyltransferase